MIEPALWWNFERWCRIHGYVQTPITGTEITFVHKPYLNPVNLSDDDIQALADEAEAGYDAARLIPRPSRTAAETPPAPPASESDPRP